jgi:hypothetical protein
MNQDLSTPAPVMNEPAPPGRRREADIQRISEAFLREGRSREQLAGRGQPVEDWLWHGYLAAGNSSVSPLKLQLEVHQARGGSCDRGQLIRSGSVKIDR